MGMKLTYRDSQRKQFGELCTQAVNLIAYNSRKRVGAVDSEWKTAIGKGGSSSNMINKYKSGKSLPRNPSDIDWLIEHGVKDGKLGIEWVNSVCQCLSYTNDDLIEKIFEKTNIY